MADALALLAELEKEDKTQKTKHAKSKSTQSFATGRRSNSRTSARPTARPSTRPTSRQSTRPLPVPAPAPPSPPRARSRAADNLTPNFTTPQYSYASSERSPSQGPDSRRVSFVETIRPPTWRFRIATKTDSLASGFPFDPRLHKFGVTDAEWYRFNNEIIETARVPGSSWTWPFHRKDVIKRIKKDLLYEGDLKRILKRWNKDFRRKRFQVWLELPNSKGEKDTVGDGDGDTREEQSKLEVRRFKIIITPNAERAGSVYSRSSSLTRSVSGEAASLQRNLSSDSTSKVETVQEGIAKG
ncbi:MAG: hypothetical protein M1818_004498 [Claussenomyces sp. TS43310]|nr:MAG: hypothetical protein M1818_004498 [Claussenomyces sp. TS43310]